MLVCSVGHVCDCVGDGVLLIPLSLILYFIVLCRHHHRRFQYVGALLHHDSVVFLLF